MCLAVWEQNLHRLLLHCSTDIIPPAQAAQRRNFLSFWNSPDVLALRRIVLKCHIALQKRIYWSVFAPIRFGYSRKAVRIRVREISAHQGSQWCTSGGDFISATKLNYPKISQLQAHWSHLFPWWLSIKGIRSQETVILFDAYNFSLHGALFRPLCHFTSHVWKKVGYSVHYRRLVKKKSAVYRD